MEPAFIYNNNLKFQDNKIFTINFRDGDRLQGVLVRKNRDYYLVSMSYFIEWSNDLGDLTDYGDITKISELSNQILKNGIDHSYEEKNLEATFGDSKVEFTLEKGNRILSIEVVEFFDHTTKQKRLVFIYSRHEELWKFELKFENKKTGHINGFTVTMKEEKGELYLEK